MIFSIVEKVNEDEKVPRVIIRGQSDELAAEIKNIMTELFKRKFPEDLMMSAIYETLNNTDHLARR